MGVLFNFFFPPSTCVGMFFRPVGHTGNRLVGIFQKIIFFPQYTFALFVFSLFLAVFFLFCAKEEIFSCGNSHVDNLFNFVWCRIIFLFPHLSSPTWQAVFPLVRLLIHLNTKSPSGYSGLGTECKPEHTRSPECNTKSKDLHFFLPKRSIPVGVRENRRPETPPALWSQTIISAHTAQSKHSP